MARNFPRFGRLAGFLAAFGVLTLVFCLAPRAKAEDQGWTADLKADPCGPPRFLAVDKSSQTFWFFEEKSPLTPVSQLPCTTGKEPGTKTKEGDLKTPEGVYFIKDRVTGGLDFSLYGDMAFTLNYPNPVDVLNGRTGHGIWIHGRGKEITPNESQGCVVLNNPDIKALDSHLGRDMPVVIANEVRWKADTPATSKEAREVIADTLDWARDWSRKSEDFFALHDAAKFSLAQGEPFTSFRDHKRQLFAKLPWIHVLIDDVRAIQGPDYWVTTFGQLYRSPVLSSEGIKRLYWQKNEQGKFLIVGMEFEEAPLGLEGKYLTKVSPSVLAMVESWRKAWESAKLNDYMSYYGDSAAQGDRKGKASIREQKQQLWVGSKAPKKVFLHDIKVNLHQDGLEVDFVQEYASKDGVSDKGKKKLILAPVGQGWAIVDEDWSRM